MRSNLDPIVCAKVALYLRNHPGCSSNAREIAADLGLNFDDVRSALRRLEGASIVIRSGNPSTGLPRFQHLSTSS